MCGDEIELRQRNYRGNNFIDGLVLATQLAILHTYCVAPWYAYIYTYIHIWDTVCVCVGTEDIWDT